jgi:16S rRNA (uracil1498-N3)-methyltransferase
MILNIPHLDELKSLHSFLESMSPQVENRFIAHCIPDEKILLSKSIQPAKNVFLLIGPEGDFTIDEIKQSQKFGFSPVSLGDNRLRTETAGIVACHTVHVLNASLI